MAGLSSLAPVSAPPPGALPFTAQDFDRIAAFAYREFGLSLQASKKDLVYSRLVKRVRALGLSGFQPYCDLLDSNEGRAEHDALVSALTTNVTHFFREEHHFKLLREQALPGLIKTAKEGGRVRIWSAGCSAGPEPYSMAMTILSIFPEAARSNFRILATDVDPEILKKAEAGIYAEEERKGIPEALRRYTESAGPGKFTIGQAARELITFGKLNLIEDWPISGPFQVIFCRNVAIYFDKPTQSKLWARFGDMLSPGGHLCIGHSERVLGPAEQMFKAVGITAYQRQSGLGRGAQSIEEPKK